MAVFQFQAGSPPKTITVNMPGVVNSTQALQIISQLTAGQLASGVSLLQQVPNPGQSIPLIQQDAQSGQFSIHNASGDVITPFELVETGGGGFDASSPGTQDLFGGSGATIPSAAPPAPLPPPSPFDADAAEVGLSEASFNRGAFNQFLTRQGLDPFGTAGGFLRGQFDPAANAFDVASQTGRATDDSFGEFLDRVGLAGIQGQAAQAFQDLVTRSGTNPAFANPLLAPFVRPDFSPGGGGFSDASNTINTLGRSAFAQQFSPFTASRLFGSNIAPRLIEEFRTANPLSAELGGAVDQFLPFVQQRLGLVPGLGT
jgi:hypothetical protein